MLTELTPNSSNLRLNLAVVEDDSLVQASFRALIGEKHKLQIFPDLESFWSAATSLRHPFDLLFLDLRNPTDPTGERTINRIPEFRAQFKETELVIQSGVSDVESMRRCIRNGASKFILKENLGDEVLSLLDRHVMLITQKHLLDKELIGESSVMQRLKSELLQLKFHTAVDVLVEGETGSGKELCARALHAGGPFIALNVSAIPAELFESEFFGAERGAYTGSVQGRDGYLDETGSGTLFLDEIQALAPSHQSKILRVLETRKFTRVGSNKERQFRGRVVCASNKNLRDEVSKGRFREDLYYRIAPLHIQVPPLRMRGADISLLAKAFLKEFDPTGRLSFTPAGIDYLQLSYDWPGNVRELRALVRNLVLKAAMPKLDAPEIAEAISGNEPPCSASPNGNGTSSGGSFSIDWNKSFDDNIEHLEKHLLQVSLMQTNSREAREKLKLARSRFYEKVKQYGLLK